MLRTEEEAKKCWCPFARYGAGECAVNRDLQSDHFGSGNKCIASECMAWRWQARKLGHSLEYHEQAQNYAGQRGTPEERHAAYMRENPLHGFCGLSGQPA